MKKNKIIIIGILTIFVFSSFVFIGLAKESKPEKSGDSVNIPTTLNLNDNGRVSARGAKVTNVSSSTISAVLFWGKANVNFEVQTDSSTKFILREGATLSSSDIISGHIISFEGFLDTTFSDKLRVKAKTVRDWTVDRREMSFSGIIQSIDQNGKSFVLKTKEKGEITAFVSSLTKIKKGNSDINFSDLKVGNIVSAHGVFDVNAKTLQTKKITISSPNRTTFEGGILKSLSATTTFPTIVMVRFGKYDYTVNIASDTAVLNSKFLKANLADFKIGDHIRVYGSSDGIVIDASVIRNVSLK